MTISARMHRIAQEAFPFERLVVDVKLAMEMFEDNPHKKKQLPNIARDDGKMIFYLFCLTFDEYLFFRHRNTL